MAYHGYHKMFTEYLQLFKEPKVLEIGVSTGITFIPLLQYLIQTKERFKFFGVDVKLIEDLLVIVKNFHFFSSQQVCKFISQNSLSYLAGDDDFEVFDLVLVDGDHNYFTVSQELEMLNTRWIHKNTLIVCDDYNGRYAHTDLFYSNNADYKNNKLATKEVLTEKHGVKTAIDEFVLSHPKWHILNFAHAKEPAVLYSEDNNIVDFSEDLK